MTFTGELAALGAAFCWSWTLIFFTSAGTRIGSFPVNVIRLTMALPLLLVTTIMFIGGNPQSWFAGGRVGLLALSGVIGLALGDAALFKALVLIGPRKTTLIFAGVPIITALIAIFTLDEFLPLTAWVAIFITVSGVTWVIAERSSGRFSSSGRQHTIGIAAAILGAVCQAIGLVFSKLGMAESVNPLPATLMRIFAGMLTIYIITLISGRTRQVIEGGKNLTALALVFGGALFGPFAGVWLSVIAVRHTEAAIAATIMALVPVFIIPVVWIVYGEKVSWRALIGTLVAVAGIALLFQR